jgi:hypothetical protein
MQSSIPLAPPRVITHPGLRAMKVAFGLHGQAVKRKKEPAEAGSQIVSCYF